MWENARLALTRRQERGRQPKIGCSEKGQVVPLFIVIIFVGIVTVFLLGKLGQQATERARAQSAADAAALAGVAGGEDAAAETARDNQASLVSYVHVGQKVEVTVRLGNAEASARAEARW